MAWDLESLENKKLIRKNFSSSSPSSNLNFLLYYVIGNLCFNHEMFSRYTAMCLPYEFTTSPTIYQMTGIRVIRFSLNSGLFDNPLTKSPYSKFALSTLSSPLFNVNHVSCLHLTGNTDMIYNFMHTITRLDAESCVELEIDSLESNCPSPIDLELFLYGSITCVDKCKLMKYCKNLKYIVKPGSLFYLISLISSRRVVFPYLYISGSDLNHLSDLDFVCLSKHFKKIYVLLGKPHTYSVSDLEFILDKLINNDIKNIKFKPLGLNFDYYLQSHNSIEYNNLNSYSMDDPFDLDEDGILCRVSYDGSYVYDSSFDNKDDYYKFLGHDVYHLLRDYF